MAPKILLPINDTTTTKHTLQAVMTHRSYFRSPMTLLHVVDLNTMAYRMIPDFQIDMVRSQAQKAGERLLADKQSLLEAVGLQIEPRLAWGSPRDTIIEIAEEEKFDLLILGRKGPSGEIRSVLFGSVANHLLHKAPCPVLLF